MILDEVAAARKLWLAQYESSGVRIIEQDANTALESGVWIQAPEATTVLVDPLRSSKRNVRLGTVINDYSWATMPEPSAAEGAHD